MSFIEIQKIWTDDDGMLKVDLTASNGKQLGNVEFFIYPDELSNFGIELQSYPTSLEHVACIEYGERPDFYSHVKLSVSALESSGRSAIEVRFDNRGEPPGEAQVRFFIESEPARLNRFGQQIVNWARNPEKKLRAECST